MSALKADDFPDYFEAIHGAKPFLWQKRLLREVVSKKEWPRTIAAPTGAGKTAVLDIALFHLAMEAHNKSERGAPVRICFAVDRRIIVDQAYERAEKIRKAFAKPSEPTLSRVAEALASFGGAPLHVEQLRGGMPREDDWARTPAQPTILCTTIDQLGSRLLFRGYGVSERMAPVHAGLLGEDCLILLDEAHLAQAFAETLKNVERRRAERGCTDARRPWFFSSLTATPKHSEEPRFSLTEAEKSEKNIRNRLEAKKACSLPAPSTQAWSNEHRNAFADAAKLQSDSLIGSGTPDPVIAVIVNRVPFARAIFEALKQKAGEDATILLTGRVRPVERDALIKAYRARLFAGERTQADKPLFVVATQCVEAGADFDFDALVTQIAPLDALRQRFGRLNRLGAERTTQAIVIAAKDEIAKSAKPDAIYGGRVQATWDWLMEQKGDAPSIDFGPNAMQRLIDADMEGARGCIAEAKSAPILRGADLAFLSMTHPRPHPDPEISLFLHGELGLDADVAIVWRADIEESFAGEEPAEDRVERLGAILDLAPPRPGEALRVPLWQARAWLRQEHDSKAPLADVESRAQDDAGARSKQRLARRTRDDKEAWEFVDAAELAPGDTLIAPSSYGGCDRFGWAPESRTPVRDIAETAAAPYEHRRAVLRVHEAIWRDDALPWSAIASRIAAGLGVKAILEGASSERARRFALNPGLRLDTDAYGEAEGAPGGAIIVAPRGLAPTAEGETSALMGEAVTDDGDAGSFMAKRLTLRIHREDVEKKAHDFADAAGLSRRLLDTLALAARLHDDGKADRRFQAYLTGGGAPAEPLAKSERRRRGEDRAARAASNLPNRWRHEALSARLAIAGLAHDASPDIDPELVVWLVGTHHGYGRPFFPHDDAWDDYTRTVEGIELHAGPGPQRLDFEWRGMDWTQLFESLKRRYGVWGLAYLEAIVRLADHRASEEREREP